MSELSRFPTASPELFVARGLLSRVDTKFLMHRSEFGDFLRRLAPDDYAVARHDDKEGFDYESIYLDTPNRQLLKDHHRGRRPRHKVRIRHHLTRGLTFFEIKQKQPSDATLKQRLELPFRTESLDEEARALLANRPHLYGDDLEPAMRIGFQRYMFLGEQREERVTVDHALWFRDSSREGAMADAMIVEVKQARYAARSPVMLALRGAGATPIRFSKYITGAHSLWPSIRLNRYRGRMRRIARRIHQ